MPQEEGQVMERPGGFWGRASAASALKLVVVVAAFALAACGGSSTTASTSSSAPPTATATQSASASPVHLVGSDSVEATQKVVDGFGAGVAALSGARFVPLYADDVVYNDYVFGLHLEGKAAVLKELRRSLREADGARVLAGYADRGWGVLEHRWDFHTAYEAWLQPITVLEIRDGKIVNEAWYYQDPFKLPAGKPLEPKPLTSAPGSADTAAEAEAVALKYAAALQAKDAAAVASLSAPKIAFMDTASSAVGSSQGQVQAHYAKIFKKPADLAFTDLRYAIGPGWATVIWVADWPSWATSAPGVTMLEIRDGKIGRETLYYNGTSMPFRL
jgi:ketosteroid isomerase-like protein